MCKCGCNTCDFVKPVLLENKRFSPILSEGLNHLITNKKPLNENLYRYGSKAFLSLWKEARMLYSRGIIDITDPLDKTILLETNLGEFGLFEGKQVALDLPQIDEAEYQGKDVDLNKPKRGGSGGKKYYVYVKDPKTKKVKKVSFGDSGNLKVKLADPKRRKAFADRHNCDQKKDKTKAGYWSCRLTRYAKSLGMSQNYSGYW